MLKVFKIFTISTLFLFLSGCLNSLSEAEKSQDKEIYSYEIDFSSIYKDILRHSYGKNQYARNKSLHSKAIFRAIFNTDSFKEKKVSGRTLFLFPDLSDKKIDYIISKIPKSLYNSGYEIFSPMFWQKVKNVLKHNIITLGFIKYEPGKLVNGFYNHNRKIIGLDSLSLVGTLEHEIRHYNQYLSVEKMKSNSINLFDKECKAVMKRAFAELDASSYDLQYLFGIVPAIDSIFNSSLVEKNNPVSFLILYKIRVSLGYPEEVLIPLINEKSCTEEIKDFAKLVLSEIQSNVNELKKLLKLIESSLRKEIYASQNNCRGQDKNLTDCSKFRDHFETTEKLKKQFETLLREVTLNRFKKIQSSFSVVSDDTYLYLYQNFLGVEQISLENNPNRNE